VAGEGKGEVVDDDGVCGEVEVEVDVGVIEEGGVRNPTSPSDIPSTPVTPAPAVAVGGCGGELLTKGGVLDLTPKSDAKPDDNLDAPAPAPPPPAPALRSGDALGMGLVWEWTSGLGPGLGGSGGSGGFRIGVLVVFVVFVFGVGKMGIGSGRESV
jgi:hypothetical protein